MTITRLALIYLSSVHSVGSNSISSENNHNLLSTADEALKTGNTELC